MGEPLSPNHVFDFSDDELELHLAYGFFAPGPLPGYANNPNNHNGWIDADVPLLRELGVVADGQMVGPVADEPIVDEEAAPRIDMDEDLAALFGDDTFDDDFDEVPPPSVYEAGGPSSAVAEGPSYPLSAPRLPVPPVVIEDLSTRLDTLEYGHRESVKKQIYRTYRCSSGAGSAGGNPAEEIVGLTQQCILGMDKRLANLERRPPGPQ
nr:hypothetical protein [Tanacetum cinerariifolium]